MTFEEKAIEELVSKVTDYGYNDEYGYYSDWADGVRLIIEPLIKSTLHSQREEIKKEVEKIKKPEGDMYGNFVGFTATSGAVVDWNEALEEVIKILDK
jgi:hypothetical protein